jgi:hypothetical protein
MRDIHKRQWLFLLGCLPVRLWMVYMAKTLPLNRLRVMGILGMFPVVGFLYLYATRSRLKGVETFGCPIWWHELRVHHFLLYLLFVITTFTKPESAYVPLLADIILGTVVFSVKHST